MAQTGYTPIQLYRSGTASATPSAGDLTFGELAINYADGKLFYKNSGGTVSSFGLSIAGATTQVIYNNAGAYAGSANLTFDGVKLTMTAGAITNYMDYTAITAPTYQAGRIWYDATEKTLSYYNDATNNAVHIGQETIVKVVNQTGSTIPFGAAVYISSAASGFTYPNIALAKADALSTAAVIGITNTAITNGSIGYVVSGGMITNINTSGFSAGDILYLSPYSAGGLMNSVPPTGYAIQVGVCANGHSSAGAIYTKQTTPTSISANIVNTGTLAVANGGTGQSSYAIGNTLYASGATTLSKLAIGTAYQIYGVNAGATAPSWQNLSSLIDNGLSASAQGTLLYRGSAGWQALAPSTAGYVLQTNGPSADPSWVNNTGGGGGGGVTSISFTTTGLTPATTSTGTVTVGGTLVAANGGTGNSLYATGDTLYASGTTTLSKLTIGAANYVKTSSGTAPQWVAPSTLAVGTATNIAGGAAGTLFYNTASGSTTSLGIGTQYQILATNTGATAPLWSSMSAVMDAAFSASAQGTLLYRGVSTWTALSPGTNGYVLTSAGAGANLTWAPGGAGGGVTSISFGTTGLLPSTASSGIVTVTGTLAAANGGTSFGTYAVGDMLYASATTPTLSKLTIGTANQVMTSSGTVPQWVNSSTITAGTAYNIAGGSAGGLAYNSGLGSTTFLALGTTNYVLTAGATAPQYVAQSSLAVGSATTASSATTATTATNIAGGAAGTTFYNTGSGATSALAIGTVNQINVVNSGATAPTWLSLSGLLDNTMSSTQGAILYRNASGWVALPPGSSGSVLTTFATGVNPSWSAISAVSTISFGTTGLTPNTATSGAVTVSGTLAVANGGTGTTTSTGSGSTVLNSAPALTNPTVTNYTETLYAIGNSSTAVTFALTNGTVQTVTMTGNCTFTMPSAASGKSFIVLINSGAGSFTGTFTSVRWPSGVAPTLTTTSSRWDIASFVSDGTNWYGNIAQAYA